MCGEVLPAEGFTHNGRCRTCGRKEQRENKERMRLRDPVTWWIRTVIRGAKSRSKNADLTPQQVAEILAAQKSLCFYCDRPLNFNVRAGEARGVWHPESPSLDQVIPGGGYSPANVVVACWECNRAKGAARPDQIARLHERIQAFLNRTRSPG